MRSKKKFLIAFIGPVGSGKTYIAKILAKKLGAVYVRTDDIRVALRRRGKSYASARDIAKRMTVDALTGGRSVVLDFDAINPRRRRELYESARKFGAKFFLIGVNTPEKVILERLKKKRYTVSELFQNSREAIRVYFMRRKLHRGRKIEADFVINNARPLAPQIKKIIKKLRGPMV